MHRLVLGLLTAAVLAGCQVRTEVNVEVAEDGSGTVEVGVGVDPEALAELPDLDSNGAGDVADLTRMVRVDDLRATGWTVGEPELDDGFTWIRASKPFGTPDEAVEVLSELTGPAGPLRDWEMARERSFGRTSYELSGTADFSGGLEAFGDEGLVAALDGEPLGEDVSVIEERFGRPLSEMMSLDVAVELPGGDRSSWSPTLGGEPVAITATATLYDWPVLLLAGLAVACGLGLVALLAVWGLRRVRP